ADESNIIADPADMPRKLEVLAKHCSDLGRDRADIVVSWQRSVCIAPTMEEARADLDAYLRTKAMDPETLSDERRAVITARFIFGDADTVGERLIRDLAVGVTAVTITMLANGHVPGRVTLLGEPAAKVVG